LVKLSGSLFCKKGLHLFQKGREQNNKMTYFFSIFIRICLFIESAISIHTYNIFDQIHPSITFLYPLHPLYNLMVSLFYFHTYIYFKHIHSSITLSFVPPPLVTHKVSPSFKKTEEVKIFILFSIEKSPLKLLNSLFALKRPKFFRM
jgi:hypothetical protein